MNRLQKELLDILEHFLKMCSELGLTYYLANGSALGAKKYGGFIPWDDDIDVEMPRADYEIFCENAKNYLPEHLFLQNYQTDKEFPLLYTKIRNTNTTFIESDLKHLDINHGIYIDIFPLDGYPDSVFKRANLRCKLKVFSWMQFCGFQNSKGIHQRLLRILGYHRRTNKTLAKMEKMIRKYGNETRKCCDYADRQGKGCVPWEYYGDGCMAEFERLSVVIPSNIEEYLTYKYDDWKSELPKEQKVSHHNALVCDLDNSYLIYMKKDMHSASATDIENHYQGGN